VGEELWGERVPGGFFEEVKHIYRDERGAIVPSNTQVLDILGMSDFSMVKPAELEWKRHYGGAVHKATEYLVQEQLDWDSIDEVILPAVVGIEQRLKAVQFEFVATEERSVATINGMRCGMTLDLRGTMLYKGVRRSCILDVKTGSKFSPTWTWQVGGYSGGAPKVKDGYVGLILQVDMLGGVIPHFADMVKALREFTILLAAANLKVNAGLAKIKGGGE
jgi:hypothetical protein